MLLSRQFVGRYDLASEYSRTTSTPQTTKAHIETTDTVIRTQLVAVWPRRPPTPPEDPSPTSFAMTTEHAVAMVTYGVTSCQVTHPIWRLSDARMSLRKHGKWRCVCVCARARVCGRYVLPSAVTPPQLLRIGQVLFQVRDSNLIHFHFHRSLLPSVLRKTCSPQRICVVVELNPCCWKCWFCVERSAISATNAAQS